MSGYRIVGEQSPAGTFFRASRRDADTITIGPSAPSPDAAVTELDRDAGGPVTYLRPREPGEPTFRPCAPARLPALVAIALLTGGCATLNPVDVLEDGRARTEEARQALEGLAVLVATARAACDAMGDKQPAECQLLADVPIDKARDALLHAAAAQQTAQEVLQGLAPYAEAASGVLAEAND